MDFLVLGPFEVRHQGLTLALGAAQQREVLAVLVLHRNEPVSTDRLVDELWGERPPPTATKALQGYISSLRRLLPEDVIATRGRGYQVSIESDQIDLERFEKLVADGRSALADGDATRARERLSAALGLWRGNALADFEYRPFASSEIARLEDLRLTALEDRMDAGLALGEHAAVVGELESLVGEHPLRERLVGQLMLALYRSGRQADALDRYRRARQQLVEDLGIEPGPDLQALQHSILNQDPALAAPWRPRAVKPSRRLALLALAGLLFIAAAVGATLELLGGGSSGALVNVRSDSVAMISPALASVEGTFPVGGGPGNVTVGAGGVWVINADDQTVTRIDPQTNTERTFGTRGIPLGLAAGVRSLWVENDSGRRLLGGVPVGGSVSRLDPDTGATLATVRLRSRNGASDVGTLASIAVSAAGVWVVNPDATVSRIDATASRVVQTIRQVSASEVVSGPEGTWALEGNTIARLTSSGSGVARRVTVPAGGPYGPGLGSIAVGNGALWATDPSAGTLWRIDLGPTGVQRTIPLAVGVADVTYGAGAVWVSNSLTGTVSRIDPKTNSVAKAIAVGNTPGSLAVGNGAVWVAVTGPPGASVPAASESQSKIPALPRSICGPVLSSGGQPQLLVASDLPLRAGTAILQMSAAIDYVLRTHGFRAGRFRLGYQSCDDSTSQSGAFDPRKCASNAKAWVQNPLLVGVIGPYNSGCAVNEIPIANRGGLLAMVSPFNSCICLTHADALAPPSFVSRLYPTGHRNYARVYPADDVEAAAIAQFARSRRISRLYVLLDEPDSYGGDMARHFILAARHLGLRVAGTSPYPSQRFGPLADLVAASRANGVFLSGTVDEGGVIRALRKRLGVRFPILADDGFLPVGRLFQTAGPAARGVYIGAGVTPNAPLSAAGDAFVKSFAASQHAAHLNQAALYAAQATEVMIDAIARSNGTRASVTRELFKTCVRNGILGSFCLDANGDPTSSGISIVRAMRKGGDAITPENTDGADVVTVIRPQRTSIR